MVAVLGRTAQLDAVAHRVARRYAARCWWAGLDDLLQVARLACVEAERTFDKRVGVPLDAYAWRAAVNSVRRYLWRMSAPVSASDHHQTEVAGMHRAPVEAALDEEASEPWADAVLNDTRWRGRVRSQLFRILARNMEIGDCLLALRVVLDGERPAEVAREHSVPVAQVYEARRRAAALVLQSSQCYRLWQELWQ